MSTDEQEAAVGRLGTQYAETKKELTTVLGELRSLGKSIGSIGNELQRLELNTRIDFSKVRSILAEHPASAYLDSKKINEMMSKAQDLRSQADDYKAQLKSFGLEVF